MSDTKRFNLTMPADTFSDLEEIARSESRPIVDVIRRFIALGMLVKQVQDRGAEVLIREDGQEDKLLLIL